jgi:putative endopeptidase
MNRRSSILLAAALVGAFAGPAVRSQEPAASPVERPLAALPYTPSLDPTVMDRSVDPCVDLWRFSCGKWSEKNPIPADRSWWNVYSKTREENFRFLWGMLEEAGRTDATRDANTQKIGDYFASCVDEAAVEKAGMDPLKADLAAIDAWKDRAGLAALLGRLHGEGGSGDLLFAFGSGQDPKNATRVIGFAAAGGLGLPSPEDYLKDDAKSKETREHYVAYIRQILELIGDPQAARNAAAVMQIETALAKHSLTPVELRDPYKTAHGMKRKELQALTPGFRWNVYLTALGQAGLNDFNVTEPAFFKEVQKQIASSSLDDLRAYLRFHWASRRSPYLSKPFQRASFDFYEAYLQGTEQMSPRWKECVEWVDRDLGEALGEVFVRKAFSTEIKADADRMVRQITEAMESRINQLPWMSPETKKQALVKLHAVRNKIGYPERWRDYSGLEVRRGDFAGNVERAHAFETRRDLAKIGKPVDRGEWGLTPPTVNAYYNPFMNDINFPAGVLLPPLYDPKMDAAPNYGNTGSTIGHELTHGFDDEGRQFDAQGNLRNWWTPADDKEFRQRVACVADQYATYTVVDDIKIQSQLTLGEDVADLGGTILAYLAWKAETAGKTLEPRDGLTPEQRFFVGFAQWDCAGYRPEALRLSARTNPHSPAWARINGVVVNMPEFAAAFSCKPGQPLVKEPEKVCRIW